VEFFTLQFGNQYTFQLYVAAAVIYIAINLVLSWLARYVERRTRGNAKTAATTPTELPADVQMGGGGGAVPAAR
jgi:glutamate transport system permease protein